MKKLLYSSFVALSGACLFFIISCDKDPNNPNAIQGTNKDQSTGTAANPNIGQITVTGTSTLTNPATVNSSLLVGAGGWNNNTCVTTVSLSLTGNLASSNTTAKLTFYTAPTATNLTTYTLTSGNPQNGQARLEISNAPGQPTGITWYSKSGIAQVICTPGVVATFTNVQCLQSSFLFPVVTASGTLSCN